MDYDGYYHDQRVTKGKLKTTTREARAHLQEVSWKLDHTPEDLAELLQTAREAAGIASELECLVEAYIDQRSATD